MRDRRDLAAKDVCGITRKRRCELLGVTRTTTYYTAALVRVLSPEDIEGREARMAIIDEMHLKLPASGARKMAKECCRRGYHTTRHQARRLMAEMNVKPCYPKPNLSKPAQANPKFPYLLRGMRIWLPNQVWATDITYIKMGRHHMYLSAVIDWATRMIVSWELADTMEATHCVTCFEGAVARYGTPSIANSDQGATFTADVFVEMLAAHGIRQSMDGRARWIDNVIIERLCV
ncbi:MAG: DDE-type integrase/transposase/recombinase [Gordonibacter sp.]|uniref:DDE-type integrase/transposase/recombinase n=1 Tax=Gordonibacter sp. TaxID=1968902 RepID=UPI002FC67A79